MRRLFVLHLAQLALLGCLAASAFAQDRVVFHGRVIDTTGAAIPGVVVSETSRGVAVDVGVTDQAGDFAISLAQGSHTLAFAADGFAATTMAVDTRTAASDVQTITLRLAGVRATVNVTAPPQYQAPAVTSAMKTLTPLRDVPQSVTVVTRQLMTDQLMQSVGDVVRYIPGISAHQGENNRDQIIIRGNSSSADFFLDGVRDDVQLLP